MKFFVLFNLFVFFFTVKNKLNDNALKLAEKYVDYHTLVSVCEMTNNCDLLETYLDKFADKVRIHLLLYNKMLKN